MINEEWLQTLDAAELKEIIRVQNNQLVEISQKLESGDNALKIELEEQLQEIRKQVKTGLKKAKMIDNKKSAITNQSIIDLLIDLNAKLDNLGGEKNEKN